MKVIQTSFLLWLLTFSTTLKAADFQVTTPGSYFQFAGINGQNPTITLTRGVTYTFAINTDSIHPFQIVSDDFSGDPYDTGVVNNNINNGTLTFSVPLDAPSRLYYYCPIHTFSGTINIVNGAPPAADFNVTAPAVDSFYTINGTNNNPTLTLTRGQTYTFAVNTDASHPFQIVNRNQLPYDNGVQNNDISSGTITFTVPMTAPSQLGYICSLHGFGGTINIVGGPATDFNVSTPGGAFAYTINSFPGDNPTLTLTRGLTYIFEINATDDHPFAIIRSTSTFEYYDEGVENNDTAQGRIIFSVPTNAPSTLYYFCSVHAFAGTINIIDPPPTPQPMVKVISISVSSNAVTLTSLGTNGWNAIPEFASNLFSPVWTVVPSFTNTYSNGTNTTTFGRLDPICGPNVFLRVKNSQ